MSIKLKALSLGLMAIVAVTGFAVVNASATVKGHFTHDAATDHATIIGTETGAPHKLKFEHHEGGTPIECTHASYHGVAPAKTVTSITVTPTYTNCATQNGEWGSVKVDVNGCGFLLYSHGSNTHGTVTVECPGPKAIEITHPNCNITVDEQHPGETLEEGITYTQTTTEGKHTLTADVTVTTITGQYHEGICIFLGTWQKFNMTGSLTVEGKDTLGNRVNITHT